MFLNIYLLIKTNNSIYIFYIRQLQYWKVPNITVLHFHGSPIDHSVIILSSCLAQISPFLSRYYHINDGFGYKKQTFIPYIL